MTLASLLSGWPWAALVADLGTMLIVLGYFIFSRTRTFDRSVPDKFEREMRSPLRQNWVLVALAGIVFPLLFLLLMPLAPVTSSSAPVPAPSAQSDIQRRLARLQADLNGQRNLLQRHADDQSRLAQERQSAVGETVQRGQFDWFSRNRQSFYWILFGGACIFLGLWLYFSAQGPAGMRTASPIPKPDATPPVAAKDGQ